MSFHKSFVTAGTDTSDATALQHHIKTGKTAYIASGKVTGTGYFPAMMKYDGSTGYYVKAGIAASDNKITAVLRFSGTPSTGASSKGLMVVYGGASLRARIQLIAMDSDHATSAIRNCIRMAVINSAGTAVCRLTTNNVYLDDQPHTIFASYDGDIGAATFIIDGVSGDQNATDKVAATTGTLETSASSGACYVGGFAGAQFWGGKIGFVGFREAYLTNWSDFMQADGSPKNIESTLSTVWGGTPDFWHESAKMDENKGSAGAMTKNGSIILAPASSWS